MTIGAIIALLIAGLTIIATVTLKNLTDKIIDKTFKNLKVRFQKIELNSAKGVNYKTLRKLLASL